MKAIASLLLLSASIAEGRTYHEIIDQEIYQRSNVDHNRFRMKIELEPYFRPEGATEVPMEPTPVPNVGWITLSPTSEPSAIPSDFPSLAPTGPTSAPTSREENIQENGGCINGTTLYQVNLYDAWGDGWAGTTLKITGIEDQDPSTIPGNYVTQTHTTDTGEMTVTLSKTVELDSGHIFNPEEVTPVEPLGTVFEGGLQRGSHAAADVCLMPRRCYQVDVSGGDFLDEVSWDIRPVQLGSMEQDEVPILAGDAPSLCTFSVPDENGINFCHATCNGTLAPEHTDVPKVYDSFQMAEADPDAVVDEAATRGSQFLQVVRQGHKNT